MSKFIADYLETYCDEIDPMDFYRVIFPSGELEQLGNYETGKYNAIAVELLPKEENKVNARRHIITDDLERLELLMESDNFIVISPISYAGKSRQAANARFIYAIAIDLDGITTEGHLRDLFYQFENGFLPLPTFTVASGTGIHLYYQLDQPLPCFKNIVKQLAELKKALTRKIWNKYTTDLYDKPQFESLFQGFRMVGGITKVGTRSRAFITGDPVSIEDLNEYVPEEAKVKEYKYKSKLTLAAAKEKYPEWYEKRIVDQQPKGTWTCKRDLFDWWIRQIKSGAVVGHRYYCIMVLAIYAKKCSISRSELEETAFDLVPFLDSMTREETNHFTREDVLAALEMFNENYITFPIDSIASLTNIPIKKNKRNYRKQDLHLRLARANKAILKEVGEMKPEGRPSKEVEVKEWQRKNPNKTIEQCRKETGMSRTTISKYWER